MTEIMQSGIAALLNHPRDEFHLQEGEHDLQTLYNWS